MKTRMIKALSLFRLVPILLVATIYSSNSFAKQDGLFLYPPEQVEDLPSEPRQIVNTLIETNPAADELTVVRIHVGSLHRMDPYVTFNLPNGKDTLFRFEKIKEASEGNKIWVGEAIDAQGAARLVMNEASVTGQFNVDSAHFQIVPLGKMRHALIKLDMRAFPPELHPEDTECPDDPGADCDGPIKPPPGDGGGGGTGGPVRILVVHTAAAASTTVDIGQRVIEFVDQVDTVLNRSNLSSYATADLAGRILVDYDEGLRGFSEHLTVLREPNDGILDSVHALRNHYSADVVAMVVNDPSGCGIARVNAAEEAAFFVIHYSCTNYTFPHELGHIFGGGHNPEAASHYTPYQYGHGYVDTNEVFRTVLAYDTCESECPRKPHYSNPNVYYDGRVTGTTDTHDVARVVRERAATVSGFRSGNNSDVPAPSLSVQSERCWGLNRATWSSVEGTQEYRLYRSSTSSMSSPVLVYSGLDRNVSVYWRSDGSNYYAVKACIESVCSPYSNVDTAINYGACM